MHTEDLNPRAENIDVLSVSEIIDLMNEEDLKVIEAVKEAKESIAMAALDAINTIQSGGSLFYIGAGTSGRLGILDASEMPPTFNVPSNMIRAIIAGGDKAITSAVEGAEDDEDAGMAVGSDIRDRDMVLGITASGKTPFVISAIKRAKENRARCWLLTCNDVDYDFLDGVIKLLVGPEIIAGSTRLKAGTGTKMVLNMISTSVMIKLGKVYRGYMVDVVPSNTKLLNRATRIVKEITGCNDLEASGLLKRARGNAKTAIVMHFKNLEYEEALKLLKESGGSLRRALKCS